MLEFVALLLSLAKPPYLTIPALPPLAKTASFQPVGRAVDNWRMQAALDLELGAETSLRWLAGASPANLPRCIRLNNYWCIKKAGWSGELASDPDGHAAFASAKDGAVAAVALLRRYYLEYGRKSARAIVAHWAPAQCELSAATVGSQSQPAITSLAPLAKYGIGNTLRARWLAARRRGGTLMAKKGGGRLTVKRSVVPDRLASTTMAARSTTVGLGNPEPPLQLEPPLKAERLRVASAFLPDLSRAPVAPSSPSPNPATPPVASCTKDATRLANYAAHVIEGIARTPDEDLNLFDAGGNPLSSLARVLANMAVVEIGPFRADPKLIEAAIETVRSASAERDAVRN
ncbi:MAG: hypothetical protein QOF41_2006 [Methylobacteriaceae bacterium]|nr:hypothetical protein [Methylobacteriaceae bacterium]